MESISEGDRWNSICTFIMKLERARFRSNNTKRHYHQNGVRFPAPGWNDGLAIAAVKVLSFLRSIVFIFMNRNVLTDMVFPFLGLNVSQMCCMSIFTRINHYKL